MSAEPAPVPPSESSSAAGFASYQELQTEWLRLRDAGDRAAAFDLVTRAGAAFPDQAAQAFLARVRLAGELGRVDEALRIFAEALAAGCRYPLPVLRSELLAPLHEIVEFERLEHIAAMRYDAELAASKPKLVVRRPSAAPVGTLLVLHGNNSRADRTVPHWEAALELGWTLALAQSAEISWTPGMFVWNDAHRAQEQLRQHLDELGGRLVVAGSSMGALRALELAASEPGRIAGAIAVGPYVPKDAVGPLAEALAVPTAIIVGERDTEGRPGSESIARRLGERGVQVRLDVVAGLGHAYPPDMPQRLAAALKLVLG